MIKETNLECFVCPHSEVCPEKGTCVRMTGGEAIANGLDEKMHKFLDDAVAYRMTSGKFVLISKSTLERGYKQQVPGLPTFVLPHEIEVAERVVKQAAAAHRGNAGRK